LDESASPEDSESLDLNQDEQPKFVNQAPQILPNQNQTANRRTESPYTGLTISPNEMEQKIGSMTKPVPESKVGRKLRANPRLLDKDFVLAYYSSARLFSDAARQSWVDPDRQPLTSDATAPRATHSSGDPPDRPLSPAGR
jgi:hypothetical protein